jgi:hypothetical protein
MIEPHAHPVHPTTIIPAGYERLIDIARDVVLSVVGPLFSAAMGCVSRDAWRYVRSSQRAAEGPSGAVNRPTNPTPSDYKSPVTLMT